MNDNTKIAKNFTVGDWKELRKKLKINESLNWDEAFNVFSDRISSRFLNPIEKIQHDGKKEGEGFSIALISVVLLEFLAAFDLGLIYKNFKDDNNIPPNEYKDSKTLLKNFILKSDIFKNQFASNKLISKFYDDIRCGLVHQARTLGNNSIISNDSRKNIQLDNFYFKSETEDEHILNRDLFLKKILEHIDYYRHKLLINQDELARRLFIMKIDEIAGLKHVWYFIYGSNLYENQLTDRLNDQKDNYFIMQRCSLSGYKFGYNKLSTKDNTAKGNLIEMIDEVTEGVAILLLEETFNSFVEINEKGYEKKLVKLNLSSNPEIKFDGYTCISNNLTNANPSIDYQTKVINGAQDRGLPEKYILKYLQVV